MTSPDDALTDVLEGLRDCLREELAPNPPCWVAVTYGRDVPMDYCGCTAGSDDGGQAFVNLAALYPTDPFPQVAQGPTVPGDIALAARLTLGIYRPIPVGFQDEDTTEAYAAQQTRDAGALWRVATCCPTVTAKRNRVQVGTWTPVGPNGDCSGGTLPLTIRL